WIMGALLFLYLLRVQRNRDREGGPDPDLTRDVNPTMVFLNDAVADAKAKAGSLTDRLRGEEGIEDLTHNLGTHAPAVIAHRRDHRPARRVGPNDDFPVVAQLDRLTRVHQQVDQHLSELVGITGDGR